MSAIAERAKEQRLQHMIEGIVMTELHPRSKIQVVVQEVRWCEATATATTTPLGLGLTTDNLLEDTDGSPPPPPS